MTSTPKLKKVGEKVRLIKLFSSYISSILFIRKANIEHQSFGEQTSLEYCKCNISFLKGTHIARILPIQHFFKEGAHIAKMLPIQHSFQGGSTHRQNIADATCCFRREHTLLEYCQINVPCKEGTHITRILPIQHSFMEGAHIARILPMQHSVFGGREHT